MEHFDSALDCQDILGKCICLAWHIWKARNDWVFNYVPVDPKTVMDKASFMWTEFHVCLVRGGNQEQPSGQVDTNTRWIPPHKGQLKINCDVALKQGNPKAAIAALLRDHKGNIIDGRASFVQAASVSQGEALAIRLAGSLMLANQLQNTIIESDNQTVIKLCSTENVPPWELAPIIDDIRLFSNLACCSFSWVRKHCNRAAHWIATNFLNGAIPFDWVVNPPPSLSSICNVDSSFGIL